LFDEDQRNKCQRQRDHVQREEAIQGDVRNRVVAADEFHDAVTDDRDRAEQRDDHLRAPVGHLAPGQQVTGEGLGHQHEEDQHADQPDQLARLLVGAVEHGAEHVQVNDDEEERRSGRMHVADQPAPLDVTHDVLDRRERFVRGRLVIHRQEDARDQLDRQYHERQHAEDVPPVETLRCVVLGNVVLERRRHRETIVDPLDQSGQYALGSLADFCFNSCHYATPESWPIRIRSSRTNR
jgi:hypothetical protein